MTGPGEWSVRHRVSSARALCETWPDEGAHGRRVFGVCAVTSAAIVIGSTQSRDSIDEAKAARCHVDVVKRPAGGGAVFVAPEQQVWVDLWIPRGDDLWHDDVVTSPGWVGALWMRALAALGVPELAAHSGKAAQTPWSETVCFAGLGPGEVTSSGAKLVGIAQRRGREGSRFLTVAHLRWDPEPLIAMLELGPPDAARARKDLGDLARGLEEVLPGCSDRARPMATIESVVSELIDALP